MIKEFVKRELSGDFSGHDYYHAKRTVDNVYMIAKKVDLDIDVKVTVAAAWLHDCVDDKLFENTSQQLVKVGRLLRDEGFSDDEIKMVNDIITNMSFRNNHKFEYLEGQIVQDADLLESIGHIGIARTYMYNGNKGTGDLKGIIDYYHERLSKVIDRFNIEECREEYSRRHEKMKSFFVELQKELQ